MFAYIKGSLEMKLTDSVVVEANGVGYKIYMAANAIDRARKHWRYGKDSYALSCKRR